MSRKLTNVEKMQRLKYALMGDASNAVYLNLATAGSVLLLFMEKIGLSKAQMGVLLALIGLGGMIAPVTSQLGARYGFKRLATVGWVLRVILLSGMIAAPWVAEHYGPFAAFNYVALVLVLFSLARSTADSMVGPWSTEFVPATIRGRYTARQMIATMLCGAATIMAIGAFLGREADLWRFQLCFTVALLFGVLPALFYSRVPGGHPQPGTRVSVANILLPLRDRVFRRFLLGHITINVGWCATMPFVPLYLKNQIGIPPDQVVSLDAITMMGSLTSSFIWGWAADRYGGKPQMVSLLAMHVLMPTGLLLMPRHSEWSYSYAMVLYFAHGFVSIGWLIGFFRYLFNNLVPQENRASYIALNACVAAVTMGTGPLWAGFALQKLSWISGTFGPLTLDAHTPFFLGLICIVILSVWLMQGLPSGGGVGVREFAGLFLQGNPILSATGLVAFRYAGREDKRVAIVERLGSSRSPLTVNELLEALDDPSFSVRYEAIVSSVRTVRDPRLIEALLKILGGADPGLQMAAVWALGRIGDDHARAELRVLLDAPYRTLRAQVARSLGMLGDTESAPRLLAMFRSESDLSLRVAYGAAVAALGRKDAIGDLLPLLRELTDGRDEHRRREVSLAIATLVRHDDAVLLLWRRMQDEPGNTLAEVLLAMRQRLSEASVCTFAPATMQQLVERCAYAFAGDDAEGGVAELVTLIDAVRPEALTEEGRQVLLECRKAMALHSAQRPEYALLGVHALQAGLREEVGA